MWAALIGFVPLIVRSIFIYLGLSVVYFTGFGLLLDYVSDLVTTWLPQTGPLFPWLGVLRVDQAITILLSAYAIRVSMISFGSFLLGQQSS